MFKRLKTILRHMTTPSVPPFPVWDEIVERMRDRELHFGGEVVEVAYSHDGAKRCVIYRDEHGFFSVCV